MWRNRQSPPGARRAASPGPDPGHRGGDRHPSGGVAEWRRQRLLRAGFGPGDASVAAADTAYDLHSLIELVERGCPPPLALRILTPLEADSPPC